MTKRTAVAIFVLLAVMMAFAGCGGGGKRDGGPTGIISGMIALRSGITGPIQVSIKDTTLSDTTDAQGNYSISGVPVGDQTVVVTVGDSQLEFPVKVVKGETTALNLTADAEAAEVTAALAASASASTTAGMAPLEVTFAGNATGGRPPYSFSWDFRGPGTSAEQSPAVTFPTAGTYTVTLTVTDDAGGTAGATVGIQVQDPAALTVTPSTTDPINVGDSITFTTNFAGSLSRQPPHIYYFFGDGQMADGVGLAEVSHTYSCAVNGFCVIFAHEGDPSTPYVNAVVPVRVVGEAAPQPGSLADVQTAHVEEPPGVVVPGLVQTAGDLSALAGLSALTAYVSIYDLTCLDWTQWLDIVIDWGDGTTTGIGDTHTYSTPGTYQVRIVVRIGGFEIYSEVVAVVKVCPPLTITNLTCPPNPCYCPSDALSFDVDTAGGCPPLTYEWDFGDGSTSNQKSPTHTYNRRGDFAIRVTVTDAVGQQAMAGCNVHIAPVLSFTSMSWATSNRVGATNAAMRARFEGGCPPVNITYDFGDGGGGGPATGSVSHTYGATGQSYNVTATARDSCPPPDQQTVTKTVTISVPQ